MAKGWDAAGSEAARSLAFTTAGLYGAIATGGVGAVVSSTDLNEATKETAYSLLYETKEAIEASVDAKSKGDDEASVDQVPASEETEDRPGDENELADLEAAELPGEADELESLEEFEEAFLDSAEDSDYSDRETI